MLTRVRRALEALAAFADYPVRLHNYDTNYTVTDQFTVRKVCVRGSTLNPIAQKALGSVYFVHASVAGTVRAWDFASGAYAAPGTAGAQFFRKERFPQDMCPVRTRVF